MLRPGHIRLPKDEAAVTRRAAAYERKQQWKDLPGNRYTLAELREMSGDFAGSMMRRVRPKRRVMYIP